MTPPVPLPAIAPETWLDEAELVRRHAALAPAPLDRGRVTQILARTPARMRVLHDRASITAAGGLAADRWAEADTPNPDAQLAVMAHGVASMIANGQPLSLFGDNLTVDLDLSEANLPVGSRVRIGTATLVVTPKPHNGCSKYAARFGHPALRFIAAPERRPLHLRGIYLRVLTDGEIGVGDEVVIEHRATTP